MNDRKGILGRAFGAGVLYGAIVFAFAFVTGVLRTLLVRETAISAILGVALELPLVLGAAWLAWKIMDRRLDYSFSNSQRAVTGALALATILVAEFTLSVAITGAGLAGFLTTYRQPEVMLGLAGQILFALFPLLARRR